MKTKKSSQKKICSVCKTFKIKEGGAKFYIRFENRKRSSRVCLYCFMEANPFYRAFREEKEKLESEINRLSKKYKVKEKDVWILLAEQDKDGSPLYKSVIQAVKALKKSNKPA